MVACGGIFVSISSIVCFARSIVAFDVMVGSPGCNNVRGDAERGEDAAMSVGVRREASTCAGMCAGGENVPPCLAASDVEDEECGNGDTDARACNIASPSSSPMRVVVIVAGAVAGAGNANMLDGDVSSLLVCCSC